MIIGIYLASYEDSIWFESTIKRKAEIIGKLPETKDGIQFEIEFKSEEDKERIDESLRSSSNILIIS